jgi:hypothetical protein
VYGRSPYSARCPQPTMRITSQLTNKVMVTMTTVISIE